MAPWYLRAPVWALLAIPGSFFFASCQRAGLTEAPATGPRSGPIEAVSPPAGERGGPVTVNGGVQDNGSEVRVEGLDDILHSPAGRDPQFRERVAFWADFWTGRQADYFMRYLDRMGNYEFFVDEELARRGLPTSLRYLPIVESGYHPTVVSRAGATGLWQIMAPTARDLGLTVSSVVDDRRDPFAATHAALDYLEQLHNRFDSWFLALAAYNAGPGRVTQVMNQYGSGREVDGDALFLEIRAHLPAETREFVPRFFAAADLAQRYSDSVIPEPITFDDVVVPDATSFDVVAAAAGVPENEILALNPHFLRGFTPIGEVRVVRVPPGSGGEFAVNFALIPPEERLAFLEHVVAAGETLSHIARRYGIPVSDLTGANAQVDPRRLQIGARVVVPVGARRSEPTIASAAADGSSYLSGGATGGVAESHLVSSGESLWTIARAYGVTTEALAAANQRSAQDVIRVGEELRIP